MNKAVIYARYSSERQSEQSIEGQLRICNDYAQKNDIRIIDTYIDRAMTGTNDNRVAFQQMLKDSEQPVPWEIVLVYAIDRFGRDSIEIAVNKQKLKKNKKVLISATQRTSVNIDGTKNLDGILLENVYIGLAEYYSAELSVKIRRGMYESRQKGLWTGGRLPYGYKLENKRVLPDIDRAEIVQSMFSGYSIGKTAKEIISDLTAKGILYQGKPFAVNTIYNILHLKKYIGICHYDGILYDNIFPALVPKHLFDEVQAILENNKKGSKSTATDFLLKGKCMCGLCGTNLQGDSGTSKNGSIKYYYKCMKRKKHNACTKKALPKGTLEKLVIDTTLQTLSDEQTISYIADEIMKVHAQRMHDKSLMNILISERDGIKKSLANIMKAIEQGILNTTTKTRMDELEQQLADTDSKINLEQYRAETQIKREQVVDYLTHSLRQEPKIILRTLIQRIVVFDDKIEIFYKYTQKNNPDDDRDYFLMGCSDSPRMVELEERKSNILCIDLM